MTQTHSINIRRATICIATAVAIALPSAASAGIFDKARKRVHKVANTATTAVTIVRDKKPVATAARNWRENKPIATALGNVGQNLPGADLMDLVKQLRPREHLEQTVALVQEMQRGYRTFSGGAFGCEGPCVDFRNELKEILGEFLALTADVPALSERTFLVSNLQRLTNLVDYVPPRALYLMKQALGNHLDEIWATTDKIREGVETLQPLLTAADETGDALCAWVGKDQKLFVELWQARFQATAWTFKTISGYIPDLEVEGEIGVEGGVGVAYVTGAAAFSLKPTDVPKWVFKTGAVIPELLSHVVKVSLAQAAWTCEVRGFVKEQIAAN